MQLSFPLTTIIVWIKLLSTDGNWKNGKKFILFQSLTFRNWIQHYYILWDHRNITWLTWNCNQIISNFLFALLPHFLPYPRYETVPLGAARPLIRLLITRGCSHLHTFCKTPAWWHKWLWFVNLLLFWIWTLWRKLSACGYWSQPRIQVINNKMSFFKRTAP